MAIGVRHRHTCAAKIGANEAEKVDELNEVLASKNHFVCRARLKRSASTSAILCAFSLSSMTELQVQLPTESPKWIFVIFAVCTTLLVAIHILALVISNFILPNIDYMAKRDFDGTGLGLIEEFPNNEYARNYIELAWNFSTVLGMFLFLCQVLLLSWVKFYDFYVSACIAASLTMVPFLVLFIFFCVYFHRELLRHSYELRVKDLEDINAIKEELDLASVKVV